MAGRQKSKADRVTEEALGISIGMANKRLRDAALKLSQVGGGSNMMLAAPLARVPFKVFERPDSTGMIFITIDADIPPDTDELRIVTLDKKRNQILGGETSGQAIARARGQKVSYRVPVSAIEKTNGRVTAELKDPIKPRKKGNGDANAIHDRTDARAIDIIELIAIAYNGKYKIQLGRIPGNDPFKGDVFPFPSLLVRTKYDDDSTIPDSPGTDKLYITVGASIVGGPSKPDLTLIVCNRPEMTTQAHKAELEFLVYADDVDHTKTFDDKNITQIHINVTRVADPANSFGVSTTGKAEDHKFGGQITDTTMTSILIKLSLFTGVQYDWKNVTANNGMDKEISFPAAPVLFYAGGDPSLTGLAVVPGATPGAAGVSTDGKLQLVAVKQDVHHTVLQVKLKQPGTGLVECDPTTRGIIFKRVEILEKLTADAAFFVRKHRSVLHKNADFTPGALVIEQFKIPHMARQSSILLEARIIGLGTTEQVLTTVQATIDSLFGGLNTGAPPDPIAVAIGAANSSDLVENIRIGDHPRRRTRQSCRVWSCFFAQHGDGGTLTFRQLNAHHIGVQIRQLHNDDANESATLDQATTRHHWHDQHIPEADLDSTSSIITIHHQKLGDKYIWDKCRIGQHGVTAESPGVGSITYYAGYGSTGSLDATRLKLFTPTVTRVNKRHSIIICEFDQTDNGGTPLSPPVQIKNMELYQKTAMDASAVEIRHRGLHKGEFSNNDPAFTYIAPNTANKKFVKFKVHHKPNETGIQYFYIIRAVGDWSATSPTLIDSGTGNDEPPPVSTPMRADIILNTIVGTLHHLKARVRYRVYASEAARGNTAITFRSVGIDAVHVIVVDFGTTGGKNHTHKFGGPLADPDVNFIDIEGHGLATAHEYTWLASTCSNGGGHTRVDSTDVTITTGTSFFAGGGIGTSTLTEINASFTITNINEAHSMANISFTQPNPAILLQDCRVLVKVTASPNGYTDATFMEEKHRSLLHNINFETYQSGTAQMLNLRFKHPRKAIIDVQVIIRGIADAATTIPTVTLQQLNVNTLDMILSGPSFPPDAPFADATHIPVNTVQISAASLRARVVLRLYADATRAKTFATVGADAGHVLIGIVGDTTNRRKKFGGPIHNTAATFIDIECDLELGREYAWLESITSKNGVVSIATSITATFFAGSVTLNNVNTYFPGVPARFTALWTRQNVRFTQITVSLTQPSATAPSNLPILVKALIVKQSDDNGASYNQVKHRAISHITGWNAVATTVTMFRLHHKRNINVRYKVQLIGMDDSVCEIDAVDSSANIVNIVPNSGEFEDDSLPSSLVGSIKLVWNQKGLRIAFMVGTNLITHEKTQIILTLQSGSQVYLWQPHGTNSTFGAGQAQTNNVTGILPAPSAIPMTFPDYTIEVHKNGHINFNIPAPGTPQASIDAFSNTIYNLINASGGTLAVYVYLYNKFQALNSFSFAGSASFSIGAGFVVSTV